MFQPPKTYLESFHFRNLHPKVLIGTASDRYAGWIGQIYSQDRYAGGDPALKPAGMFKICEK